MTVHVRAANVVTYHNSSGLDRIRSKRPGRYGHRSKTFEANGRIIVLMTTKRDTARALSSPALGLVCVTASEEIRYRPITRKQVLTLSDSDRQQSYTSSTRAISRRSGTRSIFVTVNGSRCTVSAPRCFPLAMSPMAPACWTCCISRSMRSAAWRRHSPSGSSCTLINMSS